MKKRWIGCICVSILLFLVSCSSSEKGGSPIRLVEVTHSLFDTPQYVALSKGFFQEEDLSTELTNGNGSDKAMTTLLAKEADIALAGAEAGIYVTSRSRGQGVIAFAKLTQTDCSFLVSRHPLLISRKHYIFSFNRS